ncbi:cyanophycin synthetase incomplete domain containing protein [Pandoravirus japonicus]|uniref:Cyanophycin synthetase incomplete domain containing protein n=1 Tax=Pandoravirus japonicus TaxID=2823154 RepID=A0A811BPJ9_9VIRU|nr:cyanophycin synthetase incomplete domain containing protein [Pandoravirus japonicus]
MQSGRRQSVRAPGTVAAAAVVVVLVVAAVLFLALVALCQRDSRRYGAPSHLRLALTDAQRQGRATADAIARTNAARFPRVRMTRAEHLLCAAVRLGWDVTMWDAEGAVVPTADAIQIADECAAVCGGAHCDADGTKEYGRTARDRIPRPDLGTTMRHVLAEGGIFKLAAPPTGDTFARATLPPPIVCRAQSISWTPRPDAVLAGNKHACSRWLAGHGIPVPPAAMVIMDVRAVRRHLSDAAATRYIAETLGDRADVVHLMSRAERVDTPVVIKPVEGTCGRRIVADLVGMDAVAAALARSCRRTGTARWLIEAQIPGPSHRTIVACPPSGAAPRIVYMCERLPPVVVGDGVHTIDKLLAADAQSRTLWHPPAPVADAEWMRRHGANPRYCVPGAGQLVRVRMPTNWAQGGAHWRVDPRVCLDPANAAMLCAAAACFPGRPFLVALDTVGDPSSAWWCAGGPMVHDVELNSGLEDIPGGCDWVPADESRVFDAILQAYTA